MWPTYLARVAAIATLIGGMILMRNFLSADGSWEAWLLRFGIAGTISLFVGNFVMHGFEWLVNAHRNSVDTKDRATFGLMILTAGLVLVGVAGIAIQWQNNAG